MYSKNNYILIFFFLFLLVNNCVLKNGIYANPKKANNNLVSIYPFANGALLSKDYKVFINGKESPVYETSDGAFTSYSSEILTEVKVIYLGKQSLNKIDIRPKSRTVTFKKNKNEIIFSLGAGPLKTVVEINDNLEMPLFIFTNPLEKNKPSKNNPKVKYFEAGKVYEVGEIKPESDEIIYIEGGAILKGNINILNKRNVEISGYGILDGRGSKKTVRIEKSSNLTWNGTTILNDINWAFIIFTSDSINIDNINVLSYGVISTDGIDVLGSSKVNIKNVFVCAEDDAIAIKTEKFGRSGPVSNIDIRNCVIFNKEPGNGLEIGYEINHDVNNVSFKDIDIIHTLTTVGKPFKRAAISIHNAGKGIVNNISYRNINIEDARENLIYLGVLKSEFSPSSYVPGKIKNVSFENIRLTGGEFMPSMIKGYDNEFNISDVSFVNFLVKDKCINNAVEGKLTLINSNQINFFCK